MATRKPPARQRSFSRRFDDALVSTRITDAMAKADGWTLDQFVKAPQWLSELYTRHADAARFEMCAIELSENTLKPSRHN